MSLRSTGFLAAAVLLLTASAGAHHNMSALFDFNDRVTLQGTITKIDWRNPHIYVFVEAKDATGAKEWSIEGPPPGFFRARDINKLDFENAIGKPVTAEASRARNGSNSGLLRMLTLPDGKVVSACPQNC
jgi:hypothetical protein